MQTRLLASTPNSLFTRYAREAEMFVCHLRKKTIVDPEKVCFLSDGFHEGNKR